MASGMIGRPDWRASMITPSPVRRASLPGTSAVMPTERPSRSVCTAALNAWRPPRSLRLPPAPAPLMRRIPNSRSTAPIISASRWRASMMSHSYPGCLTSGSRRNWPCHMVITHGWLCACSSKRSVISWV